MAPHGVPSQCTVQCVYRTCTQASLPRTIRSLPISHMGRKQRTSARPVRSAAQVWRIDEMGKQHFEEGLKVDIMPEIK